MRVVDGGGRRFDDGDGLAIALTGTAGLRAELIKRLVHEFGGASAGG